MAIGAAQLITVGLSQITKVGKSISVEAGDAIEIKVGKSIIRMDKEGNIEIIGAKIKVAASGPTVIIGKDVDINP